MSHAFIRLSLDCPLVSYLQEKLQDIQRQQGQDTYLKTLVILPTRRAVKELKKNLLLSSQANAVLFPTLVAINDLSAPLDLETPTVLSEVKRKGLILTLLQQSGQEASPPVARLLMTLLDEINTHEADPQKLLTLVPEVYAEHWQITSHFLRDFLEKWHGILAQENSIEQSAYTVRLLKATARQWNHTPPQTPVILAGLDGFIPAVKNLITAAQSLPQGSVVLNGYLPSVGGDTLSKTHPNYLPDAFADREKTGDQKGSERAQAIAHLMSDQPFEERDLTNCTLNGITLLECETLSQEVQHVALLARQALEDPRKITAIVTPDQELAEKLRHALSRWHIRVDLAGGVPLSKEPLGRFILDALNIRAPFQDAVAFLNLLKSPFARLGYDTPYDLKKQVRRFEQLVLRSSPANIPPLEEDLQDLMTRFNEATTDFITLKSSPTQSFKTWLQSHIAMLEAVNPRIWEEDQGTLAAECFKEFLLNTEHYPPLSLGDYVSLLSQALGEKSVREAVNHPRLKLLSPIQGAYSHYDTAILCGLNEGVWPTNPSANPWLNRDMSLLLGLPDAQVLIGRAASLLAQNMTCPKVYLSFSKRRGTEPATPSRWVLRLQALAQKLNHPMSQKNPDTLGDWQRKLDQPDQPLMLQAPQPCPPQKFRPTRFSISEVERFFRDPYQIHAKRILKLDPLRILNEPFTQADFGTWVHKVLEQSVLQNKPLESLTRAYLPQSLPRETATLWLKSFTLFHPWIVTFLQKQKEQSLETFVEKKLTRSFDIQGTTYELVGKADRIDRLTDGTYEIIDYKTGTPPSKASVLQGDAPQLPLLAYLFEKNTPHAHVSKLTYVGLTSQKTQSIICENLANDTARRLFEALEHYHDPKNPYGVNPYEALQDRFNSYAHLERTVEWLGQDTGHNHSTDQNKEEAA
ncbi:MAG: hypothetical protein GW748_00265 [Alphaproteobacteria bacterium]|nr:hypothetical protein [Alphaproteobacteria bacterium]NCQ66165.1 hypothetical protein [Alphaproteobacteria bacterium]NCT06513.1 hypothetical protein [Alphaproteobacteria bacterium]